MNAKKFSDAMSELDTKYVDEALNYKKKAKKPIWVKWGAMAACLCLIVVAIITIPSMLSPQDSDGGGGGIIADAPPMIYVNDTLYKQSTKQTSYNELKDDFVYIGIIATVYKGNIIKNLIMDCQSYTKYRPNETTGGIFVSWRRKEELPTGA